MSTAYALLVGVGNYLDSSIQRLEGPVNDVANVKALLNSNFEKNGLKISELVNENATRDNIIAGFRSHLSLAKDGDLAIFYYSGHGSTEKTPEKFADLQGGYNKNETIVCYDSRSAGVYDLADKELGLLIEEVEQNGPEVVVIMDCCHSGSGTRITGVKVRQESAFMGKRPLSSYLNGAFENRNSLPASSHILLAASAPDRPSLESLFPYPFGNGQEKQRQGLFTSTLLKTLYDNRNMISYSELVERCRWEIRRQKFDQRPELNAFGAFQTGKYFLNIHEGQANLLSRTLKFNSYSNHWEVNIGALEGIPADPNSSVIFEILEDDKKIGLAEAKEVLLDKCLVNLFGKIAMVKGEPYRTGLTLSEKKIYSALVLNQLSQAMPVFYAGNPESVISALPEAVKDAFTHLIKLVNESDLALIEVVQSNADYQIIHRETREVIFQTQDVVLLAQALNSVAKWHQFLDLQSHREQKLQSDIELRAEVETEHNRTVSIKAQANESGELGTDTEINIYLAIGADTSHMSLHVLNQFRGPVYVVTSHLSRRYGIETLDERQLFDDAKERVLIEGDLGIPSQEPKNHLVDIFKIISSADKFDYFQVQQPDLESEHSRQRDFRKIKKAQIQWLNHQFIFHIFRELRNIDTSDIELPGNILTIKGHPQLRAGISIVSVAEHMHPRKKDREFVRVLEQIGGELIDLAGNGKKEFLLDLHYIKEEQSLAQTSLEVKLNLPLEDDKTALVFVDDGEEFHVAGVCTHRDEGSAVLQISHLPISMPEPHRATRMAFVKMDREKGENRGDWVKIVEGREVVENKLA